MRKYNLGFISDEDIFKHVKETVLRYSASIDLKEFNKNIVDPIKLTFDAKVYGRTMEEVVASECMRQMDKSNNNHTFIRIYFAMRATDGLFLPKGLMSSTKRSTSLWK